MNVCMSRTSLSCRRFCCRRKPNARSVDTKIIQPSSIATPEENPPRSHTDQLIYSDVDISLDKIDSDRLTKEYLQTINEYRFRLGFSSLELSNELNERAIQRANELSSQDHVENTNRFDLIHNNEPIGETIISCRAPVSNGHDLARSIHDQLVLDLENGHSSKKRYTPILNPDCQYLGFGLVRNEGKPRDLIVIYYYPVEKSEQS